MNLKSPRHSVLVAIAVSTLLVTAQAQPPSSGGQGGPTQGGQGQQGAPPSVDELFKMMDTNKDQKLEKSEIRGPLLDDFAKIDTNKDGYLTKQEIEKGTKPRPQGQR